MLRLMMSVVYVAKFKQMKYLRAHHTHTLTEPHYKTFLLNVRILQMYANGLLYIVAEAL